MKILSDLPRNARNATLLEPLWSLFGVAVLFYAPLYMKEIGLNEIEIGIVSTVNVFVSFIFYFLAGPITNRMGRKRTTIVFDLISWTIPMFIWAIAQNFWYFIIAAVINACVRVVVVSWYCLIIEDTPYDKRSKVFAMMNLINAVAGVLVPITGWVIAHYGTVPTLRVLYILGMISMTVMFLVRNALTAETQAGRELMQLHSKLSITQSLKSYVKTIFVGFRNRSFMLLAIIYIITNFIMCMNFLQVIYIKDHLGFSEKIIALIPGVGGIINILLYVFVMPKLKEKREEKTLAGAFVICAIGALLFIFIPKGNLTALLGTMAVISTGGFLMGTFRDSVFMNRLGEHEKADMYAAVQILTAFACIPAGFLAGYMYSINYLLPFAVIIALFTVALFVSYIFLSGKQRDGSLASFHN